MSDNANLNLNAIIKNLNTVAEKQGVQTNNNNKPDDNTASVFLDKCYEQYYQNESHSVDFGSIYADTMGITDDKEKEEIASCINEYINGISKSELDGNGDGNVTMFEYMQYFQNIDESIDTDDNADNEVDNGDNTVIETADLQAQQSNEEQLQAQEEKTETKSTLDEKTKNAVKDTTGIDLDNLDNLDNSEVQNGKAVAKSNKSESKMLKALGMSENQAGKSYSWEFAVRLANSIMGNEPDKTLKYSEGEEIKELTSRDDIKQACEEHPYEFNPENDLNLTGCIVGLGGDKDNGNIYHYGVVVNQDDKFYYVEEARSKTNNGGVAVVAYAKNPNKGDKQILGFIPTTGSTSEKAVEENNNQAEENPGEETVKVATEKQAASGSDSVEFTDKFIEDLDKKLETLGLGEELVSSFAAYTFPGEGQKREASVDDFINYLIEIKKIGKTAEELQKDVYPTFGVTVEEEATVEAAKEAQTEITGKTEVLYSSVQSSLEEALENAGLNEGLAGNFAALKWNIADTPEENKKTTADEVVEYLKGKNTGKSEDELRKIVYPTFGIAVEEATVEDAGIERNPEQEAALENVLAQNLMKKRNEFLAQYAPKPKEFEQDTKTTEDTVAEEDAGIERNPEQEAALENVLAQNLMEKRNEFLAQYAPKPKEFEQDTKTTEDTVAEEDAEVEEATQAEALQKAAEEANSKIRSNAIKGIQEAVGQQTAAETIDKINEEIAAKAQAKAKEIAEETEINNFKKDNAQYLEGFNFDSLSTEDKKAIMDEFAEIDKKLSENPEFAKFVGNEKGEKKFKENLISNIQHYNGNVEKAAADINSWIASYETQYTEAKEAAQEASFNSLTPEEQELYRNVRSMGGTVQNAQDEVQKLRDKEQAKAEKLAEEKAKVNDINDDTKDINIEDIVENANGNTYTNTIINPDGSRTLEQTFPDGNKATYEYDKNNNLTKAVFKYPEYTETDTYYEGSDRIIKEQIREYPNGDIITTGFYENRNKKKEVQKYSDKTDTLVFDENGKKTEETRECIDGNKVTEYYDKNGNITSQVQYFSGQKTVKTTFNDDGTRIIVTEWNDQETVTTYADANGNTIDANQKDK